MAHPYHHALSSAKKWGGAPEDYLPIHSWFDESKAITADFRHRALRHHAEGIFMAGDDLRPDDHAFDGPRHPDPLGGRAARERGSRLHPGLRRLGALHPPRVLDGPGAEDQTRRRSVTA